MRLHTRLSALCVAAVTLLAQGQLPKGIEKVTSVEGITEYKLQSNGLRILLFPDPTKDNITVNVTYLVGSRHENYGETGMAHLLEHLVFKGTPKHPNIPQELTSHGARPNGTTWTDRTNYFETFAATEENLKWALDMESDRMVNSFIAKKDLDSEMTVVRNEFEMGENNPTGVLMKRVMSVAYDWHNYGKSTIGSKADLENVPIDRLQAFYKKYYQPDNAILTVAGKIDEPKTLALINEYFGGIPKPDRKLTSTYTLDPTQDGERTVAVRRVGDVQAAMAAYHVPDAGHADTAALEVIMNILGGEPEGRLYKALVESKKATMTGAGNFTWREPGLAFLIAMVRKDGNLDDASKTMLGVAEEFASKPPTQEEVDRAKTQLLKNYDLAMRDSTRIGLTLSEPAASGDWRLWFLTRDRIKDVKPEDVQRVAKTYFKMANRTLGLFHPTDNPDRSEVPPPTDVLAALKDYKGGAAIEAGEAFDPSIANVKSRLQTSRLPGGMKLALLPKKSRGSLVQAVIQLHFGTPETLKGQATASALAGQMMMRGTTKHTRQQIKDEFDRLNARVFVGGGDGSLRASIETTRQNLPAVLRLVAEVLQEPAFPANEFDTLKREMLTQYEQVKTEPSALAQLAVMKHMNPYQKGDPRYVEDLDERIASINALKLEDVAAYYKKFAGASDSEFVVVGDFDPAEIRTMAQNLFGSWKSPTKFARIVHEHKPVPALNKMIPTPDKANAVFVASLNVPVGDEHPDYPALYFANYLLGGGFLNSRLAVRIRQKEGLSYGVSSMYTGRPKQENGVFMANAISAPQNVVKVEAAFRDEVAKALKDGFTDQEIAEAKKGWLQGRNVSRANDNELASLLASNAFLDRTLDYQEKLEASVSALTSAQIVGALRKHVTPDQISVAKAGDFKKAGIPVTE